MPRPLSVLVLRNPPLQIRERIAAKLQIVLGERAGRESSRTAAAAAAANLAAALRFRRLPLGRLPRRRPKQFPSPVSVRLR